MDLALRQAFRRLHNDPDQLDSFANQALRAGSDAVIAAVPIYYSECDVSETSYFKSLYVSDVHPDRLFETPNFSYFRMSFFVSNPLLLRLSIEDARIRDEHYLKNLDAIYDLYASHPASSLDYIGLVFHFDGLQWIPGTLEVQMDQYDRFRDIAGPADIDIIRRFEHNFLTSVLQEQVNEYFQQNQELFLNHARNYCACVIKYIELLEAAYHSKDMNDLSSLLAIASYGREHFGELYWIEPDPRFEGAGWYRPVENLQEQLDRLRAYYLLYQLYLDAGIYAVPPNFPPDFSDEVPEELLG